MSAGCIFKNKFIQPSAKAFKGYVDYIDRDDAVRDRAVDEFSIYQDYMSNEEKSTGLFTADNNCLNAAEKSELKTLFKEAQEKGSLMYQPLFSFKWDWLQECGIADQDKNINEDKLREYTRDAMRTMQYDNNMDNYIWSAAIHYNTEHVHIHIAMVDPNPSWEEGIGKCQKDEQCKLYQRGFIPRKNTERIKSRFINNAIDTSESTKRINALVRDNIVYAKKASRLKDDNDYELRKVFKELYMDLPKDDLSKLFL